MTDLFIHWVDVAHWIMATIAPRAPPPRASKPSCFSVNSRYHERRARLWQRHRGVRLRPARLHRRRRPDDRAPKRACVCGAAASRFTMRFRATAKSQPSNAALEVKSKQDGTLPHLKNFLDCTRSRKQPNAPVEIESSWPHARDMSPTSRCAAAASGTRRADRRARWTQRSNSPTMRESRGAALLRPGSRSCPRLGVRFYGVRAAFEQQFRQLQLSPAACPIPAGYFAARRRAR